jgi:Cohesin domain
MHVLSGSSSRGITLKLATIILVAWLFSVAHVLAADILVSPSSGSYSTGQTVTVQADPKGQSINAVEAGMTFNPAVLSVVSVSKTGSAFSLWTTEPTFSNTAGTITFGGGSPTPFTAKSALLSVTFTAKAVGTGAVSFGAASALAADGRGTDVRHRLQHRFQNQPLLRRQLLPLSQQILMQPLRLVTHRGRQKLVRRRS